jgi:hypothetical protein
MGLLFAIIEVSKSPATTIAVITETEARGPVTDLVLVVTVVIVVLVLIVFAFILSYARVLLVPGIGFDFSYLAEVLWEVFGGILICLMAGFVVENFSSQGRSFIHAIERVH